MTNGKRKPSSDLPVSKGCKPRGMPAVQPGRIGILGGAFNPLHNGHLIICEWICEDFSLNKIIFVPTYLPPHKETSIPFRLRYQMVERGIRGNKKFALTDLEKNLFGPSYTIKTIHRLKEQLPGANFFLIIGSDQFREITTWFKPAAIMNECQVIVVKRPGYEISKRASFYREVLIARAPTLEISSSQIRKRVRDGLSIRYLVPPAVEDFIRHHRLYR